MNDSVYSPGKSFADVSVSEVDSIDARHIRAETRVMLNSGKAVEKTLKNVFKTDTKRSRSDVNSLATDSLYEFGSSQSSVSKSLLPLSQSSVISKSDSIILPLGDESKFDARCWDAFARRAREQGDLPMDGGLCIDVESLGDAMKEINSTVTMQQFYELADKFQLTRTRNVMLSWNDFFSFASTLFEPAAIRPSIKSPELINKQVQLDRRKAQQGLSHPYRQLMQRQRASSAVRYDDIADSPTREIAPFASLVDIGGGAKVSKQSLEEKKVLVYRKEAKALRKPLREEDDMHYKTYGQSKSLEQELTHYSERLLKPLEKSSVYHLGKFENDPLARWEKMKKKRDERYLGIEKRHARQEMLATLGRVVQAGEKTNLRNAIKMNKTILNQVTNDLTVQRQMERQNTLSNISHSKAMIHMQKTESSAALRDALQTSSLFSRSMMEEERLEKALMKPPSMGKLSSISSAKFDVSEEIAEKIKNAKRYSEYEEAKKEAKRLHESTLSERWQLLAKSKSAARLKAVLVGTPISIQPSQGQLLFNENQYEDVIARSSKEMIAVVSTKSTLRH